MTAAEAKSQTVIFIMIILQVFALSEDNMLHNQKYEIATPSLSKYGIFHQ